MGTYLGRLCPHPQPWVPGGQRGAHLTHQLVPQRHPVVHSPPCCLKYLRIWQSWPVVAFLRLCLRILQALWLFLGILTSFCRRRHQMACGQRRVMPEQEQEPRVLERQAHQERGPEHGSHPKPQASVSSSCCKRNAITSSYSSTRGFPPVERRRQPATHHARLPQRLPKTVSQQGFQAPSSSCQLSQRKSQPDSVPGDTRGLKPSSSTYPLSKRKSQPDSGPGDTHDQRQSSSSYLLSQRKNQPDSVPGDTRGLKPSSSTYPLSKRKSQPDSGPGDTRDQRQSSSSYRLSQRKNQPYSGPGDTCGQRPSLRNRSPSSDRLRRRKFPLLPHRRGDPLRLPPAPELGYRITPEDYDAEKKARWQRISSALRGDPEAMSGCSAPEPLRSSLQPATATAPAHIPSTPWSTSLPVTSAGSAGPSACTPTAMAPKTASDSDITPMDTTPVDTSAMDPTPMDTTPVDTSAMDPTPMDTTPPSYAHFSGAPPVSTGGKQAAAAPAQASTSTLGQPAPGSTTQATLGTQTSTQAGTQSSTQSSTQASTQARTQASTQTSTQAGTQAGTQASTGSAIAAPGPSGTATQSIGGSVGRTSRKRSSQRTLVVSTGPNPQNNPMLGGTTAPMLTTIPGGAPKHSAHPSSQGLGTISHAAASGVSLPASIPSYPATAVGTSRAGGTTSLPITWAGTQAGTQAGTGSAIAAPGPSGTATQSIGGSVGRTSRKRSSQRTLIVSTGPNPQNNPVLGATTAPTLTPILGGAPKHNIYPSSGGLGTTSHPALSGVSLPASTPSYPATAMGTSRAGGTTSLPITWAGTQAGTGSAIAAPGPSGTATHSIGGSVGQTSWKRSSQRTLVVSTGPNPQNNPVLGATTASTLTPILGGAPKHNVYPSSGGLGTTSHPALSGVSLPASTPSYPATAMGASRAGGTTSLPITRAGTQAGTQAGTGSAIAAPGPSGTATQSIGGSVGRTSRKRSSQRTLVVSTGPNPQNNPVLGATTASTLTPILGGAPKHNVYPSSGGLGTTSHPALSGVSLPASTPSYPATAMGASRAGGTTSLPITWAAGAGPTTSKSSGLVPNPASHTDVTPMDTTPPK